MADEPENLTLDQLRNQLLPDLIAIDVDALDFAAIVGGDEEAIKRLKDQAMIAAKTAEPDSLATRVKNAIPALKYAEDLARHKDAPLTEEDLHTIGEACEDAIIAIRLLWTNISGIR
jgi:hypothetical protein